MEEGEPILGGPQAASGSTAASNVGPQPINPAAPAAPSTDFSSFQSNAQPNASLSSSPTQPISPARPQSVPRLTNRYSDRAALNQSPQTPIINSAPQNMQFVQPNPQIDSYASEIMSSPAPQPKKSKKWIAVVLILLALTGIGIGAVMFVPTLLAGPVQEVTEEQYETLYTINDELDRVYFMIEDGTQSRLSFYKLFVADDLQVKDPSLYNAISFSEYSKKYNIDDILDDTPNYINKLNEFINSVSEAKFSSSINKKIQEIQTTLPVYSDVLVSFINKINELKIAFVNYDSKVIGKLVDNSEIQFFIELNHVDYVDMLEFWNNCISTTDISECSTQVNNAETFKIIDDTSTVQSIFRTFMNDDNISTVQSVNSNIDQLLDLIEEEVYEK